MSILPHAAHVKSALKLLALAVTQGIVIGSLLGVSVLFLAGRLDEYLVPICEFDGSACQASVSRLLLPYPTPFLPVICACPGVSLAG